MQGRGKGWGWGGDNGYQVPHLHMLHSFAHMHMSCLCGVGVCKGCLMQAPARRGVQKDCMNAQGVLPEELWGTFDLISPIDAPTH